jgi:sortase A
VRKNRTVEDLTVDELRRLLVERRRASRQDRLERFRRTGRVVMLTPDIEAAPLENLRTGAIEVGEEEAPALPPKSRRKRILDGLLLGVEILAVLGLLVVLFSGLNVIRELNNEVAAVLEQPTLTPTPLIVAVVLPSGHTPPTAPGGAQPNEAEIPDHLRPLVQSLANIPVPTPGPQQAIRIQIPAINVDAPVVQGDGWEQLKKGVGQHVGSANPGENGNLVLSAHNDIFGEIFRDLERLKPGDEITIFTNQRPYTFLVTATRIVDPTQVDVMDPTSQPSVTLISCYPYMVDDQRIVVSARLESETN